MIAGFIIGIWLGFLALKSFLFTPISFILGRISNGEPLWYGPKEIKKLEQQIIQKGNPPMSVKEGYEMKTWD